MTNDEIMNQIIDNSKIKMTPIFKELYQQSLAHGLVYSVVVERKWWNPFRYTRGKYIHRLIGQNEIFGFKKWWEFWK